MHTARPCARYSFEGRETCGARSVCFSTYRTRERCWLALGPLQAAQPQLSKRALNLGASTASHNRELDVEWMIVRAYHPRSCI